MKKIRKQFKKEGWKHKYSFDLMFGTSSFYNLFTHVFIKDDAYIEILTNCIRVETKKRSQIISVSQLNPRKGICSALNKICSRTLISLIIDYLAKENNITI